MIAGVEIFAQQGHAVAVVAAARDDDVVAVDLDHRAERSMLRVHRSGSDGERRVSRFGGGGDLLIDDAVELRFRHGHGRAGLSDAVHRNAKRNLVRSGVEDRLTVGHRHDLADFVAFGASDDRADHHLVVGKGRGRGKSDGGSGNFHELHSLLQALCPRRPADHSRHFSRKDRKLPSREQAARNLKQGGRQPQALFGPIRLKLA